MTTEASPILPLVLSEGDNHTPSLCSADDILQESSPMDSEALIEESAKIPPLTWSTHHKTILWGLLSCLSALFADTSYVPFISIWHPTCLLFFTFCISTQGRNYNTRLSCYGLVSMTVLLRAVPAMDYFYFETTRIVAYLTALAVISFVYLWTMTVMWIHVKCWRKAATKGTAQNVASLALPVLLTAVFQLLGRFSPIGGVGNPAMGLAQISGLRQVASLVGEEGLTFWMAWCATVVVNGRCMRVFRSVSVIFLLYGSVRERVGRGFYLRDITKWQVSEAVPLRVSCLTRATYGSTAEMIARTNARLVAGDDLIVWSESATIMTEQVSIYDLFDWEAASSQSVVAVTYLQPNGTDRFYNTIEMIQADRESSKRYDKNRPVPVVEANVLAGSTPPTPISVTFIHETIIDGAPTRTSVTLQVAMMICFDLDFAYLGRSARKADLVIGPSWYWASLGDNMWNHNKFRSIENGYTLLKCSEEGISGALDPYGRELVAIPTLQDQVHVMEIPVAPRVPTVYASFGFLFGWICVGLAPVFVWYAQS
eukprot:scaffold2029_cov181-Amphora_coffeaeformis.AAC.4